MGSLGLRSRIFLLVLLALLPGFALLVATGREQQQQLERDGFAEAERLAALSAEHTQRALDVGRAVLINLGHSPQAKARDPVSCSAYARDVLHHFPLFANAGAVDLRGDVFCSAVPLPGAVNAGDRPYLRRAMEHRELTVSGYQLSRTARRATVNLGYPITRGAEVVGASFLALDLAALQAQLDALPLPPDALVTVVDRGGVVVARRPRGDRWVGIAPDLEVARLATTGGAGTLRAPDLDGVDRRFAYRAVYLPDAENALFVTAGVPASRAAPWSLARSLWLYLGASVVALLAAAAVGELGVARPLGAVIAAARRLSAGDVGARCGLRRTRGEVGDLAAAFDDLARKVGERRQLEEQLRQVQKMEAVGQLAGGIAHDFNNILTAILTFARFARDELPPGSPVREDILEIVSAAERAAGLTRQLLAFSRRQASDPRPMVLADAVRDVEKMLRRVLGEHIEIAVDARGSGAILADADQITQVLLNLALNARDAMPRGGRLTFTVSEIEGGPPGGADGLPDRPLVVLEVGDTGVGMDDATQARLFEPFFTTKEQGKGTGLGLASVYGIVTQAHGEVRVRSAPGAGSTFTLYFPRHEAQPSRDEPVDAPAGGRETVLVVEDDDAVRAVVRRTLSRAGYEVLEASRASEADLAAARPDPTRPRDAPFAGAGLGGGGREAGSQVLSTEPAACQNGRPPCSTSPR